MADRHEQPSSGLPPHHRDEQVETVIGNLLRWGVILSATLVLIGAVVYLVRHGGEPVEDRSAFVPQPPEFSRPLAILTSAWSFRGRALIQLGLLVLIATPIARVVFCVYSFWRQRDWLYVAFTLVVLGVLLYGLVRGTVG